MATSRAASTSNTLPDLPTVPFHVKVLTLFIILSLATLLDFCLRHFLQISIDPNRLFIIVVFFLLLVVPLCAWQKWQYGVLGFMVFSTLSYFFAFSTSGTFSWHVNPGAVVLNI